MGTVAYCVLCIDINGREATHIFSTAEKRRAFMDADARIHIAYDYLVDEPAAHEQRRH